MFSLMYNSNIIIMDIFYFYTSVSYNSIEKQTWCNDKYKHAIYYTY